MASRTTTLFIEDTNIKLLVAKGSKVEKWASAPLEIGLVNDGIVISEDEVAARIKELFQQAEVKAGKVIVGLSGLNSLYRIITLPDLPGSILSEAVRREASRVIPASLEEVYLSYQPIPDVRGTRSIFLAAFPQNATDALIRTLRKANLEAEILDLAPLALCQISDRAKAIIVSARLGALDIIIMVNRVPQVIRSLSIPSESSLTPENLAIVTEELERTITFYNTGHADEPLDSTAPIMVSGDLAGEPDMWPSLAGSLDAPVSVLASPLEPTEGFPVDEFMINIGLALKKLAREKEAMSFSLVNFNALPEIYLPQQPRLWRILTPIGMVVGLSLVAFLFLLFRNAAVHTESLRAQLAPAEYSVNQLVGEVLGLRNEISGLEAQIEPLEVLRAAVETEVAWLQEQSVATSEDLIMVVSLKPGDVTLQNVAHSSGVILSGISPTETEIFGYARALRNSGRFSSVLITSIAEDVYTVEDEETEEEVEVTRFSFRISLQP